jgi:hypothetical protein
MAGNKGKGMVMNEWVLVAVPARRCGVLLGESMVFHSLTTMPLHANAFTF